MARVVLLSCSISLVLIAGVASTAYLQCFARFTGDKLWDREWRMENENRLIVLFILPAALVWGPAVEELLMRLPLILLSEGWGAASILMLLASVAAFVLWHILPWFVPGFYFVPKDKRPAFNIDPRTRWGKRRISFIAAAGISLGCLAIQFESLWLCVIVHSVTNAAGLAAGFYRRWKNTQAVPV